MMPKHKSDNRGIAVIIAVTTIALLVTMVIELNRKTGTAAESANMFKRSATLDYMTSSGIHMAMALLVKDKKETESDSLQEDWADPDVLSIAMDDLSFEEGTIEVTISDELGRIQINALVEFPDGQKFNQSQMLMWERFLGYLRPEEGLSDDDTMPSAIINSTKDWLDSNDDDAISGVNGAESDYYLGLDPPYSPQNGPFDSVDSFLLVKGVAELMEGVGGLDQVAGYITHHGVIENKDKKFTFPGKININTADLPVLAALLPLGEEHLAMDLIAWREETSDEKYTHDLKNLNWYKQVPGLADITIDPKLIATSSDFYRIEAIAVVDEITQKTTAVIKREKEKKTGKYICKVLYWKSE
jgi:general secretion pathway protein K